MSLYLGDRYIDLDNRAYSYRLLNAPSTLPVSLDQVKEHLKLDTTDISDDAYLTSLVKSVVYFAEKYTGRDILTKQYLTYRDTFYSPISLKKVIVQSVDSVKYLLDDVLTTLATDQYYLTDVQDFFGEIWAVDGVTFPTNVDVKKQAIQIIFRAGYGIPITTAARASDVVTVTTTNTHYYTTGDSIVIAGGSPSTFNGTYTITVTSDTTFTYENSGSDESATPVTYMTANKIPEDLILAMLNHITRIYQNRGDCVAGNAAACQTDSIINLPPETLQVYSLYQILQISV